MTDWEWRLICSRKVSCILDAFLRVLGVSLVSTLFLFIDYDLLQNDLEEILNVHKPNIENHIHKQVDTQAKGHVDLEELLDAVK